jgi:hypothetical protein
MDPDYGDAEADARVWELVPADPRDTYPTRNRADPAICGSDAHADADAVKWVH